MKLVSLLNEELIFCGLTAPDRRSLYQKMVSEACRRLEDVSWEVPALVDSLIEREDSLGMAYEGVALPHTRVEELDDLYIIIGVLEEPMTIKPGDLKPCQLVIMSLISGNTSATYLKMLSAFTRYLSDPVNLHKLTAVGDAEEFLTVLRDDDVKVKRNITAEDMMTRDCARVQPDDSLSVALDIFNRDSSEVLPVVDVHGKLVGVLDATEVIKSFIPDYIFMMDHLKFLSSFEVFEKIFKEENRLAVKDYMLPVKATLAPETPLIQFTVGLARRECWTYYVVDASNTLLGEISVHNIIHKVLRG